MKILHDDITVPRGVGVDTVRPTRTTDDQDADSRFNGSVGKTKKVSMWTGLPKLLIYFKMLSSLAPNKSN